MFPRFMHWSRTRFPMFARFIHWSLSFSRLPPSAQRSLCFHRQESVCATSELRSARNPEAEFGGSRLLKELVEFFVVSSIRRCELRGLMATVLARQRQAPLDVAVCKSMDVAGIRSPAASVRSVTAFPGRNGVTSVSRFVRIPNFLLLFR